MATLNTLQLVNCYLEVQGNRKDEPPVELNPGNSLVVRAESGYRFEEPPYLLDEATNQQWSFVLRPSGTFTNTMTFALQTPTTIVGVATKPPTVRTITGAEIDNCTILVEGVEVTPPFDIATGEELTLLANVGYGFYDEPYLYSNIVGGRTYLTIAPDGRSASVIFEHEDFNLIKGEALFMQDEVIAGTNNVYYLDIDTLRDFSEERYNLLADPEEENLNLNQFIINLLRLPFEVPETILGDVQEIELANKGTGVDSDTLVTDVVIIELGEIEVTNEYGNLYDLKSTTIKLHLPIIGIVDLEVSEVVGHTISARYLIDVYSGRTTYEVSSTNGGVIMVNNSTIGDNIPMASLQDLTPAGSSVNIAPKYDIDTMFIQVVRNEPIDHDSELNPIIIDSGELSSFTGFIKVDDVSLAGNMLLDDVENIKSILNSGVFINE